MFIQHSHMHLHIVHCFILKIEVFLKVIFRLYPGHIQYFSHSDFTYFQFWNILQGVQKLIRHPIVTNLGVIVKGQYLQ